MGFYFEMSRRSEALEYVESQTPSVFWTLYAISGFALFCMGAAAYHLMGSLFQSGHWIDITVVSLVALFIPFYFLAGVKFALVRKFVRCVGEDLCIGYFFAKRAITLRRLARSSVQCIELVNVKPSANVGTRIHNDRQYHIRGHWQIQVTLKGGKVVAVDKSTEKEVLEPLFNDLIGWRACDPK